MLPPASGRLDERMSVLSVSGVLKSFDSKEVLSGVSFSIEKGEIFGILGPNGAGKTTLLRIIMDIIRADGGSVELLGKRLDEGMKSRVGYLPEERGLYKGMTVIENLTYFASLKGMGKREAKESSMRWLKKIGMEEHAGKKAEELSKGMAQKIQFVASVVHDPELLVLDEPFSGLDPVNSKLVKDLILELKARGKTLLLSTHQMDQVERMCDRIVMINHGKVVLYGELGRIKSEHGADTIIVEFDGRLPASIHGVSKIENYGKSAELVLAKGARPGDVLKALVGKGLEVTKFEVGGPSLNEIFISLVEGELGDGR